MSRKHPGKSVRYKMKINTYLKRKPHRECLKRAHELFDEQYPGHKKKMHKITMIKNQLLLKS